jgi:hypothetical protein
MWSDVITALALIASFLTGLMMGWHTAQAHQNIEEIISPPEATPPDTKAENFWVWHDYYHQHHHRYPGPDDDTDSGPWTKY